VPLFYQHTINHNTAMGIWKIEETEAFFLSVVPLERDIVHPHKRLQHLAGRYLLRHLFADFPYNLIRIADTRKPFLINEAYHFSISHCGNYAAAIVSKTRRVGIDIELVQPKVGRVREKFLGEKELTLVDESKPVFYGREHNADSLDLTMLTLCWSAKESVYKWYGYGHVDFKNHIRLTSHISQDGEGLQQLYRFSKEAPVDLIVKSTIFDGIVMSYVLT
jgi:phosphopantetheinyl transferase